MKVLEDPQLERKRKLPWFIDIFLYPLSISGIINLIIFLCAPILINLIHRFILNYIWLVGGFMAVILYLLFVGYVLYYLSWCVVDSAKGGLRAPDITIYDTPDKAELLSQLFLVLGSVAVCFCPASVYYIFTERTDLLFWLLLAYGIFFLPMVLLRAIMFDTVNALNPILIVGSIFKAFLPYCGLILIFCIFAVVLRPFISNLPKPESFIATINYLDIVLSYQSGAALFCRKVALIYLAMIAAHLLGRFYWWNKDKLDW